MVGPSRASTRATCRRAADERVLPGGCRRQRSRSVGQCGGGQARHEHEDRGPAWRRSNATSSTLPADITAGGSRPRRTAPGARARNARSRCRMRASAARRARTRPVPAGRWRPAAIARGCGSRPGGGVRSTSDRSQSSVPGRDRGRPARSCEGRVARGHGGARGADGCRRGRKGVAHGPPSGETSTASTSAVHGTRTPCPGPSTWCGASPRDGLVCHASTRVRMRATLRRRGREPQRPGGHQRCQSISRSPGREHRPCPARARRVARALPLRLPPFGARRPHRQRARTSSPRLWSWLAVISSARGWRVARRAQARGGNAIDPKREARRIRAHLVADSSTPWR